MRTRSIVGLLACLTLLAPSASAIYMITPLQLTADRQAVEPGDEVVITVAPVNESARERFAGRTLPILYTRDGSPEEVPAGEVTLDASGAGSFRWTVPSDVDDANVYLTAMDGEEGAGTAQLAVGDAPAVLMATGGPADSGPVEDTSAGGEPQQPEQPARDVPATGIVLGALALVVAVVLVARRRG